MKTIQTLACLVGLVLLAACSRDAVPVRYGRDECAHCKMTIVDQHFGAELVTAKGKVLVFDDVGCLFQYQRANPSLASGAQEYVVDFAYPAKLIPAPPAVFLVGDDIRSPMGSGIAAFGSDADRQQTLAQLRQAKPLSWSDLPRER